MFPANTISNLLPLFRSARSYILFQFFNQQLQQREKCATLQFNSPQIWYLDFFNFSHLFSFLFCLCFRNRGENHHSFCFRKKWVSLLVKRIEAKKMKLIFMHSNDDERRQKGGNRTETCFSQNESRKSRKVNAINLVVHWKSINFCYSPVPCV